MKKKIKRGRTEGGKQTHNERKGYLGREEKGGKKEKMFWCLMGESRSLRLVLLAVTVVFFFPFIEMRKTQIGAER